MSSTASLGHLERNIEWIDLKRADFQKCVNKIFYLIRLLKKHSGFGTSASGDMEKSE